MFVISTLPAWSVNWILGDEFLRIDEATTYLNIKLKESDHIIGERKDKDDDNEEQAVAPGGWLEKLWCQENQKR